MNNIKVAVVTAVFLIDFNVVDNPSVNFEKCEIFDYFMFTNDKSKVEEFSKKWQIIEIDCSDIKHGVYITKRVKWLTHEYLPDYDIIIWVDSFIVPNYLEINEIKLLIDKCLDVNANQFIHMRTQNFYRINDDIRWCKNNHRISESMSIKIIDYIEKVENFDVNKRVQTYWSSAIIKNNKNENLINMSKELFTYIQNVCYRDQHILPVLFNKYNINCNIMKGKNIFINNGKQNGNKNHKYTEKIIL